VDLDLLRSAAADSEGVIHLACRHDFAFSGDIDTALALDLAAIQTFGEVLAGTIHGEGDHGLMAMVVAADLAAGTAAYIADGTNRWPAVHHFDAARLVQLELESAPAGSALHAVGEQGVPLREVAEAIGHELDLPVTSITAEQAAVHFGFLARFLAPDIPASRALTREMLPWEPSEQGVMADIAQGHYHAAAVV
jgi:hypothetical protein